jgi:peptide deformylase
MIFEVIPNEQTLRVPDIEDIELFLRQNIYDLTAFREYAETRTDAAGLAANQCSIGGYRFMARAFALRIFNSFDNKPLWKLIIDPQITEYIGIKDIKCEGCLTWKGRVVVAERSRAVRVSYYNEVGEKIIGEIYRGFDAQVWQHEINHLNGVPEQIEERSYVEPKALTAGRNDLCPCGSGKKYKNCCLI